MEKDILNLVLLYTDNNKVADLEFVIRLVDIVVQRWNLSNYVKDVQSVAELDPKEYGIACAAYSPAGMKIVVAKNSIDFALKSRSKYAHLFNKREYLMFKNLTIAQFILHELEHAYQSKIADINAYNTTRDLIIRASYKLYQIVKNPQELIGKTLSKQEFMNYVEYYKDLYKKLYKINPIERMAEINSCAITLKSLELIKDEVKSLYEFNEATVLDNSIKAYTNYTEDYSCPTEMFLSGINEREAWEELDFYDENPKTLTNNVMEEYSLSRRLNCGLPIKKKEYKNIGKWLDKTNKYSL